MRVGWIIDGTLHIENKWGAQELYQPALVILVLAYLCALHLAILTLFSLNLSNCWLARFIQLNFVLLLEFYITCSCVPLILSFASDFGWFFLFFPCSEYPDFLELKESITNL